MILTLNSCPAPDEAVQVKEVGIISSCAPEGFPVIVPRSIVEPGTSAKSRIDEPLCWRTSWSVSLPVPVADTFAVTVWSPGSRYKFDKIVAEPELLSWSALRNVKSRSPLRPLVLGSSESSAPTIGKKDGTINSNTRSVAKVDWFNWILSRSSNSGSFETVNDDFLSLTAPLKKKLFK